MAHEFPAALLHFLDRLGKDLADLRVQGDGCLHARRIEHVGETPQADAYSVFPPRIVEDVRHVIGWIGADTDTEGGVVVPHLHVGREPDCERVVARPLERLAFGDEGIVVALRTADRRRRGLRLSGGGGQAEGSKARASSETKALCNEFPTVMTDPSHGDMLPFCWPYMSLPRFCVLVAAIADR